MKKHSWRGFGSLFCMVIVFAACSATQSRTDYAAILAHAERPAAERELDAARKPAEVLSFYGVKRGDRVADIWAGRGYYTAILSQVVGQEGSVYSVNPTARQEINDRWKKSEYANVRTADGPLAKLALPQEASLDFVIIHLNYHDVPIDDRAPMNRRILASLKRNGIYAVVDHSAKDGSGNDAIKALHRIDKLQVVKEVTDAGFKLAKEGNMLRKPGDTRDFNVNKERNKDDRFVLAFQKP